MNRYLDHQTKPNQPKRFHFKQEFEKLYHDALAQENLSLAFKILQSLQNQNETNDTICPCKFEIKNIEDLISILKKWIN